VKVTVVGAGVIGCAVAYELARRGARVRVADPRPPGHGATHASAGILAPYIEGHVPSLLTLGVRSLALYDDFIKRVVADSGLDVEFARCGTLQVAADEAETMRLSAMARTLAQVDDVIHEQITMLALELAHGLLRRELRTDPSQVIGMVRETVALLPVSVQGVRVALHPEDAALVRERLVVAGPESAWAIIDDPALARGDCRVYTDYAQIDARIGTRLNEALAALLGDERSARRDGGAA
jgi:hypothetical protein